MATASELLSVAEGLSNAKEIYEYVFSYNEEAWRVLYDTEIDSSEVLNRKRALNVFMEIIKIRQLRK